MQRIHAVFFHQGAPALGEGALRTDRDLQALRAAAVAHLSPAGQLQVATALDMLAGLEARLDVLRRRLLAAARSLSGARVLAERVYGVGPVTGLGMTCWLGGVGRFSSSRKAGQTGDMNPRPDHGEESYRGSGRLAGKAAVITRAARAPRSRRGCAYPSRPDSRPCPAGWRAAIPARPSGPRCGKARR